MRHLMSIICAVIVCISSGAPAQQRVLIPDLPELYAVTGVSPDDVLNVYEQPTQQATIVATLHATATRVEITALTQDRQWGRVNVDFEPGWVSMQSMQVIDMPFWWELSGQMYCNGADPSWRAVIDGDRTGGITIIPEGRAPLSMKRGWLRDRWGRSDWGIPISAAINFEGDTIAAAAIIRAENCTDGTTPRLLGLSVHIATSQPTSGNASINYSYSGCCSIADH
ncbi:MAG: hypothetical protein ACI82I_000928 [Gammaproteobacteria bacterium]|jgi:hypothetical protein